MLKPQKRFSLAWLFEGIRIKNCIVIVLSAVLLAFGLYHIHSVSGVTEGGVLGLNLLLEHHFDISPAITNAIVNILCYGLGFKLLGRKFILYSLISTASFSISYRIFEQFPVLYPNLANHPLAACLIGALFVGISCGLSVRMGAAVSGDDALAMSISHLTHVKIQWVYLFTDFTVLGLSLTYIPLRKIAFSFLTVLISGQLVGFVQSVSLRRKQKSADSTEKQEPTM